MNKSSTSEVIQFLAGSSPEILTDDIRQQIADGAGLVTKIMSDFSERSSRAFEVTHYNLLMLDFCEILSERAMLLHSDIAEGAEEDPLQRIRELESVVLLYPSEIVLPRLLLHVVLAEYYKSLNQWSRFREEVQTLQRLWETGSASMHSGTSLHLALTCTGALASAAHEYDFALQCHESAVHLAQHRDLDMEIAKVLQSTLECGVICANTGEIPKAKKYYGLAVHLITEYPDQLTDVFRIRARDMIGCFEASYGSPEKGIELTEGNAQFLVDNKLDGSRLYGNCLLARSETLFGIGKRQDALRVAESAIHHLKHVEGAKEDVGPAELTYAWYLCHEGEALKALEIAARLESWEWARSRCNFIAAIAFYTIREWDKALEHINIYVEEIKKVFKPHSDQFAVAEYYESLILESRGGHESAIVKRKEAISRFPEGSRIRLAMEKGELVSI